MSNRCLKPLIYSDYGNSGHNKTAGKTF
uniref:Uncharacterized protein n=1 Tax=Arundo donax TaxID=35708 RepID=A0A0A9H372_ARUDO